MDSNIRKEIKQLRADVENLQRKRETDGMISRITWNISFVWFCCIISLCSIMYTFHLV